MNKIICKYVFEKIFLNTPDYIFWLYFPEEDVSNKLVETRRMKCTQNQAVLDDLKSKTVDLINYFSHSDFCNDL